ncbi:phosphotransferase enzyme family protein [Kitasatospora sp. NPDC048365]|uniref:phosphotransferase enzyme family protein n=1 Tax=Kitasatospora sp. NPDC048365 TaxID=3364050 RepID=UPI00371C5CBA
MSGDRAAPLRAVLLRACAAASLPAAGAAVIRIGENALWRLPGRVVARIGRPGQTAAAREPAVARWLDDCGVPAVRPLVAVPGPVEVDGRPVTFWHELPPHRAGTAAELAPLLRRLHGLPTPDLALGRLDPFVRLAARIDGAATLGAEQRRRLHGRLAELEAAWAGLPAGRPTAVLHGDAWGGNLAVTATTAYLLDFERTSTGPPEWDLASTAVAHGTFGTVTDREYAAFCAAYGADVTDWPGYPVLRDVRELRVTCYALQLAAADPARHRAQAHYRLACLRGEHGPRPWAWTAIS